MRKKVIMLILMCCIGLVGCSKKEEVELIMEVVSENEVEPIIEEETEPIVEEESSEIETRENTTFRNSCWGDDIETVKKYEDAELFGEEENGLVYKTSLLGKNVYAVYYFKDNKLYNTAYTLIEELSNGGQYIELYNSLKTSLTEKYEKPLKDDIINYETQSLIDIAGASSALEYGYIAYICQWITEKTEISMGLRSENSKMMFVISYKDINYEEDINDSGL